jgi:hypothetical protein
MLGGHMARPELNAFTDEVEAMGFPIMCGGVAQNTFDIYND